MMRLFQTLSKNQRMLSTLANMNRYQFAFDAKKVVQDSALFELETSQLPNGQIITDKLYDLTVKLENQSPFNDSEKSMMSMMSLADYNLKFKNFEIADKIFATLRNHLEEYQENNMAFYQYLTPSIVYRQAIMIEEKIQKASDKASLEKRLVELYQQVAAMIEEYSQYSETLIEENVHLQAKVYEKLANHFKKNQNLDEALTYYTKAVKVGEEVYSKSSIYVIKMNCFMGDILSRSEKEYERSLIHLQKVLDNIHIKTPQDAQIFSIAATSLLKVLLSHTQQFSPQQTKEKIDQIELIIVNQDKEGKLIAPLSRSVILTMKAENELNLNLKEQAKKTFDDSLALALQIFPPTHSFVQNIFKKMQQL